jgi:RimJ/RimL family protein N-acetyltransferase
MQKGSIALNTIRPPSILETARLILRPPRIEDAQVIFNLYAQDPEVTRYLIWEPHTRLDATLKFIEHCMEQWEKEAGFPWVITQRSDSQVLGMIELRIAGAKADLGYVLARRFWGNGFASEAARLVADWAISRPGIYRVWAVCDVDNLASARVLEKAGMQKEGVLRRWVRHVNISQEPRDCLCFSRVK